MKMKLSSIALLLTTHFTHAFSPTTTLPFLTTHPSTLTTTTQLHSETKNTTPTPTPPLNPAVTSVKISSTVQIFSQVQQMQADGIPVTSLCVGEPDFPPPTSILTAAASALTNGQTRYTAVTGTASLRSAIAADLKGRKGLDYDAKTEIVVGNGAKQCVYQGILATCGVGDACVVPAPYWPSYPEMVALAGATPLILETREEDGYLITASGLRSFLEEHSATQNIQLLILCNPSNPTGGVHPPKRLEELAEVLEDHPQISILSDEIYERLVYSDTPSEQHVSIASLSPSLFARTMTVNGFSKAYAMTGMRLGYLAAPLPYARAVTTIQSQLTSCAGSVSQAAGVAALTEVTEEEMERNVGIMREKRDFVLKRLGEMEGVKVGSPPMGAFYVLPDVSAWLGGDDERFCLDLLEKKRLALVPGSSFGAPGTVRISYATSLEELGVAMDKLGEFLEEEKEK